MLDSRAKFEVFFAWARGGRGTKHRANFDRDEAGDYTDRSTQRHWWTWQNAVASTRHPMHNACHGENPDARSA